MQCPTCDTTYDNGEASCRQCGTSFTAGLPATTNSSSTALLPQNEGGLLSMLEHDLLPVLLSEPVKKNIIRGAAMVALSIGLEMLRREAGRQFLQSIVPSPGQFLMKKGRLGKKVRYTVIESVMVHTRRTIISK